MDPLSFPGASSSHGAGSSSGGGSDHHLEPSGELEHAVNSIFQYFQCTETQSFNPESISERLAKKVGHTSKKPFSVFYERFSSNRDFVVKYEDIKFQNNNNVDPFVRLLVRIREDKKMIERFNGESSYSGASTNQRPFSSHNSARSTPSLYSSQYPVQELHQQYQLRYQQQQPLQSSASSNRSSRSRTRPQSTSFSVLPKELLTTPTNNRSRSPRTIYHESPTAFSPFPNAMKNSPTINSEVEGQDDSFRSPETVSTPSTVRHANPQSYTSNRKVPAYLSRDFHPCDWPMENDCFGSLSELYPNVNEQEQILLQDLLFVLIGIEGKFIRLKKSDDSSRYRLVLDPTADGHLSVTINQILKISYCYSAIVTFVESKVYGLVNQALVAAMQRHMMDYNILVSQMEDMLKRNDLFLQKMFFMLLPYISTFNLLKDLGTKLYRNKCVGGGVLSVLHEKTKSIQGMDNKALELCLSLTKSSSVRYFEILKTWIYYGEISDPRREFFIEDTHQLSNGSTSSPAHPNGGSGGKTGAGKKNHKRNGPATSDFIESDDDEYDDDFGKFNDKYWDQRYRINSSKIPVFLKKYEQIIYKTGKYVSIINKVKALYLKSSRVPPALSSATLLAPSISHAHSLLGIGAHSIAPSESKYSLNELLRGAASMQFGGNGISYGAPSVPSLQEVGVSLSSNSSASSSSNSALSFGPAIFTPKPEEIQYSFDESSYVNPIMSAYDEASSQLLHILINESALVETFNAVKHYMLLSMGDFIVHFMKFASKDLCKETDSVVQHRLDSMMGMALGISVAAGDRDFLKEDPHVEFTGKTCLKQIFKIMKPLDGDNSRDEPSPSSSYLLKTDLEDDDDDDEDENDDVGLNRSIISDVIEGRDFVDDRWATTSAPTGVMSPGNFLPGMSISSQVRLRKQLYINSGGTSGNRLLKSAIAPGLIQNGGTSAPKNKLYCYESLMLKFDVPFPLSLIFTQKSIICYQLLFRYMFLCRYAEMELEESWKDNVLNVQLKHCDALARKAVPEAENTEAVHKLAKAFKGLHKKAFALRYKMIAFVRNFHYFYAFEVIDPLFAQFISQLTKRGSSLDSVIDYHEKFLEQCFSSLFLTSLEVTSIIIKIFMLCIEISHALKDSIDPADHSSMMESSCFFSSRGTPNPYATPHSAHYKSRDHIDSHGPASTESIGGAASQRSSPIDSQLYEKLNQIYFGNRHKSVKSVKEIVERANAEFDTLVAKLHKKIDSDNCEYHMMYPFLVRLDFNDFYRRKNFD